MRSKPGKHGIHSRVRAYALATSKPPGHAEFNERGPVRAVVHRGPWRVVGNFPSTKMHMSLAWESGNERNHFVLLETDFRVVAYHAQPETISLQDEEGKLEYTPDVRVQYRDGRVEIVEVKPEEFADDSDVLRKARLAQAHYVARGQLFRTVVDTELNRQPRLKNAERLLRYASLVPPSRLCFKIKRALTQLGQTTMGELLAALGDPRLTMEDLYGAAVQGCMNVNLEAVPLGAASLVSSISFRKGAA